MSGSHIESLWYQPKSQKYSNQITFYIWGAYDKFPDFFRMGI